MEQKRARLLLTVTAPSLRSQRQVLRSTIDSILGFVKGQLALNATVGLIQDVLPDLDWIMKRIRDNDAESRGQVR